MYREAVENTSEYAHPIIIPKVAVVRSALLIPKRENLCSVPEVHTPEQRNRDVNVLSV